jgi:hypothetical protein
MNRFALGLVLGSVVLFAADGDVPPAETILDHFIEVTGGKAAYEKVHTEVAKGTMEMVGRGVKGTIVSYQAEPDRAYTVADIQGVGKVESGSDGGVVWEISSIAGPRVKTGDERDEMMRTSLFNAHLHWRKLYTKAETSGLETVDGEACYKVVLTPKTGQPVTEFYSKKSGLLIKTSAVHATQMGDIAADDFEKDYKEVSGVLVAFTRINKFAGQEMDVRIDSIEFNAEIPRDRFDLPETIKALLRKNGAPPK